MNRLKATAAALASCIAIGLYSAPALSVTLIGPTNAFFQFDHTSPGANISDDRDNLGAVLDEDTSTFRSLGKKGAGVFSFGSAFSGTVTIWETTNGTCTGNTSGQCTHWPEAVDVYVGNTWDGNFSNLNLSTNWTSLGTLGNAVASGSSGGTLNTGTGTFQYLLLIDKGLSTSSPQDGFDVAMVKVSAVPIPAAFWLFGSALLGMISLGRRHTSKSA